jgi:hypothetical protein
VFRLIRFVRGPHDRSSYPRFTFSLRHGLCKDMARSRLASFLCLMAVFQLMGGHWAVLQVSAWVGMLVNYSKTEGVERGILYTFDGRHPCNLCLSIAKSKQAEKKQNLQLSSAKLYAISSIQGWTLPPPNSSWGLASSRTSWHSRDRSPPVPPPRAT